MKSAVQAGLVLGITVVVWTALHAALGWYKDPGMSWTFWMVIPFELILVVFMLKNTKKQGFRYGQQVAAGLVMSLVGGAIIFVGCYVLTTMVFPTYYADVRAMAESALTQSGQSPEQIKTILDAQAKMMTPLMNSVMSFVGTVVTGLFGALVAGVFIRNK
jgi:hypothetical protein